MPNKDAADIKEALRCMMKTRRLAQSSALAEALSLKAQQHLLCQDIWRSAPCVALYLPTGGEVHTFLLLKDAWDKGKVVLLPRCRKGQRGLMDFVPCTHMEDVLPGHFGILEPRGELAPFVPEGGEQAYASFLVVLPGLAFDQRGYRLGFGGGYYDRFLAGPLALYFQRVGLAYSWQKVEHLPVQEWDSAAQAICTEEGVLWV